jgi:hypothetical protein
MADGLINLHTVEPLAYQLWLATLTPRQWAKRHKYWANMGHHAREEWRKKARVQLELHRNMPDGPAASRMAYWHERHMVAFPKGHELHTFHQENARRLRRIAENA